MKLRNKKTGKIGWLYEHSLTQDIIIVYDVKGIVGKYASLAELDEEWEDAPEEPKEYWFLSGRGEVKCIEDENTVFDKDHKSIGNYFESREEAEKAVEKLKAWKRLGNKGFRFTGYDTNYGHHRASFVFEKEAWATETEPDLDLLFGGEE